MLAQVSRVNQHIAYVAIAASLCAFVLIDGVRAQTAEEHARHHPDQAATPAQPGASPAVAPGGMMGGMGEMMSGMHGTPPKELYPTLMSLTALSAEQRKQVEEKAAERIRGGNSVMVEAVDALARSAASQDYAAMHEATVKLHEGMTQLESGIAARRALAEGRAPPEVALEWFRREMNLPISAAPTSVGLLGNMQFHIVVITILGVFAAVMIFMYFYKMRRAEHLLQALTGGGPSTPPARSTAPAPAGTIVAAPPATTVAPATQASGTRKWSGKLRIGRIFQETSDVKTFRLMNPLGGPLPFTYLPGQFITVTLAPDNQPVKRSYTIASSPTQHDYVEITVKHEDEGIVSGFLHNHVKEGDLLDFSGPSGFFTFTGRECKCILLIAGGVGITPLMSVLRYLTDRSWPGDVFLLYCIKTPRDIIFREELDYLQRRHPNLRVVITVSRPEGTDWKGPTGRITKELIVQTVPDVASRYVHICGPVPMMEVAKKMLIELGVPSGRTKTEAFGPALGKPEPILATAPTAPLLGSEIYLPTVTFSVSDKSAPLPPDKVILDVADEIGVEIDNSCRVGTCGTCRVKLLSGQVTMAVEDGLEPGDKERGMILACQAKATANVEVEA